MTSRSPFRGAHRAAASAAALLLALVGALLLPGAASAAVRTAPANTGWLRMAHLSPDTADVDIYLTSFKGSGSDIVLRSVGYGDVSDYRSVPAGTYTASMRPAGAAATSTPTISATALVEPGRAYTIAAVGKAADLTGRVLTDDLTPPPAGQARVRLIQASTLAPVVDVVAVKGPVIAQDAAFATSTGYANVPAGRWTLQVKPKQSDVPASTATVDLRAGTVDSLFVLDGQKGAGALVVRTSVDSSGAAAMPAGGVDTGYGPSAHDINGHASSDQSSASGAGVTVAGVGLLGLLALVGFAIAVRARRVSLAPRP